MSNDSGTGSGRGPMGAVWDTVPSEHTQRLVYGSLQRQAALGLPERGIGGDPLPSHGRDRHRRRQRGIRRLLRRSGGGAMSDTQVMAIRIRREDRAKIKAKAEAVGMTETAWIRKRLGLAPATMGRPRKSS